MDSGPCFGYDESMPVEVTPEETAVLIRWKKRTDNCVLARMKAEAILYASRGVDVGIIAEMVERSEKTVREWPAGWQNTRMCSVLTGHAGNSPAPKNKTSRPSWPSRPLRRAYTPSSGTYRPCVTW